TAKVKFGGRRNIGHTTPPYGQSDLRFSWKTVARKIGGARTGPCKIFTPASPGIGGSRKSKRETWAPGRRATFRSVRRRRQARGRVGLFSILSARQNSAT